MLVKVGPLRSASEAASLRGAQIVGVQLAEADDRAARRVSEATAAAIRDAGPAALAIVVDPLALDAVAIGRLAPDYLEFTPADPEKPQLLDRQLAALAPLGVPLIATGLLLAKDDLGLLDRAEHLDRLLDAGAALLQIELDSAIDPAHRIPRGARERLAALLKQRPALVSDAFTTLDALPGLGERGAYLELGDGRGRPQTFSTPAAARLLRGR